MPKEKEKIRIGPTMTPELMKVLAEQHQIEEEESDAAIEPYQEKTEVLPALRSYPVATAKIPHVDTRLITKLGTKNRQALLEYLAATHDSLQAERENCYAIMAKIENSMPYEAPATAIVLSKLLDNAQVITKEMLRITKILAELNLNWEQLDAMEAAEANNYSALQAMAGEVKAEGLDLLNTKNDPPWIK